MKAVLSPFRKADKDRKKLPPTQVDDLEYDGFKPTTTAWASTLATKTRFRGTFGSKAKAGRGPFRGLTVKKRISRMPDLFAAPTVEIPSPENSNTDSRKSISDSPSERSQDLENLINPPPQQRRLSHLATSAHEQEINKPFNLPSSFAPLVSSQTTRSSSKDEANEISSTERMETNYLDGSMTEAERDSKKYRTRRPPIEGDIAPLSTSQHKSFSHLAASAQDWKLIEGSTPTKQGSFADLNGSSPSRSVASNRKRAVGGSPIFSDYDDASVQGCLSASRSSSSTSGRPIYSRSRIFSPEGPAAPMLPFALPVIDAVADNAQQTSPTQNGRGVMDIDSDRDSDDDASDPGSPDTSFEQEGTESMHPEYEVSKLVETEQDVLESMSSYRHLRFLIKALRSEAKRVPPTFGGRTSWTVAPSGMWNPARRVAFYEWATVKLGFTLRAIGNSASFLQISAPRGAAVLEKLTKALQVYKETELGKKRASGAHGNDRVTFNLMDRFNGRRPSITQLRRRSSMSMLPSPMAFTHQAFEHDDMTSLDLATKLQNLSVRDNSPKPKDTLLQPLVRAVTLETHIDLSATARSSLEHSVADTQDIMFHLHGRSFDDDVVYRRPPRNSGASMRSSTSSLSHRSSAPFPAIGAAQSFECIETPCMDLGKNWGSCPFQGSDWGESDQCEEATLQQLLARFEESTQQTGILADHPIAGITSILNFDCEMDCESERVGDLYVSESPEKKVAVRFDAVSPVPIVDEKDRQKRRKSFAKLRRLSLCYQQSLGPNHLLSQPHSSLLFSESCPMMIDAIRERISSEVSTDYVDMINAATPNWQGKSLPLADVFAFLTESELKLTASLVSQSWADAAATAHATLMTASVGYLLDRDLEEDEATDDEDEDLQAELDASVPAMDSIARSMERPWTYLVQTFPWGCYLAEGGMKKVYKAYNTSVGAEEAIAVMDTEHIREKSVIAAELSVSSLLSDLVRRRVCPNFVLIRGVFNCPHAPPKSHWGSEDKKTPKGVAYDPLKRGRLPREPLHRFPGRYHYIRMELCDGGDAEEYIKAQPEAAIPGGLAQSLLFQTAFALHAAADRCSMKHYDIKLLNLFLQGVPSTVKLQSEEVVLRYGLGSHVFSLRMPQNQALFAKLADYGTANVKPESNGQPITIGQFTTIENTPPDFMILGDKATQGHGHDNWGLGLVMLHLFTGEAPYEEIMDGVVCPPALKKRLRKIWEDESVEGYNVIRTVILADVELDEAGHIVDGEPDDTPYDTLYRALVLFGIPDEAFRRKECPMVWDAIIDTLVGSSKNMVKGKGQPMRRKKGPDSNQYNGDCRQFSMRTGNNKFIARARAALERMEGGLDLLLGLCNFDPVKRLSAMDAMNSAFMAPLREVPGTVYDTDAVTVHSFTSFSTNC
ncbi:hypothetical protein MPSEU_000602700 [Mayamaea pseudoterrestris]|nr:hypothetical protein MPSEU_000602700 [Mayamaea pseudoterrestris]